MIRKIWNGFKAAVTSPEVVKQEKSLAVLVGTRLLIAVGASAGIVEIFTKLLS